MEKIQCICVMRDLMQALAGIENNLMEVHGVSLNEAMVLCSIGTDTVTAGTSDSWDYYRLHGHDIFAYVENHSFCRGERAAHAQRGRE